MNIGEIKKERKYWQRMLRVSGYYTGEIDGIRGPLQKAAEAAWEQTCEFLKRIGSFDQRSEENIATLLPSAQQMAREWLKAAKEVAHDEGYDVKIICGTRSYAEQDALYKRRPRVTRARGGQSWHNFGLAFDFGIFSLDGKEYVEESPLYAVLGKLARQVQNAEWGGDWNDFKDEPHVQLRKYRTLAAAREDFERS